MSGGIPPERIASFTGYFRTLDKAGVGYVTGQQCFDFFRRSGLENADLGKIWSLSATPGSPHLRLDEFLVAMHLITERCAKKPIPETLPADLVPASHSSQSAAAAGAAVGSGAAAAPAAAAAAAANSAPLTSNTPLSSTATSSSGSPTPGTTAAAVAAAAVPAAATATAAPRMSKAVTPPFVLNAAAANLSGVSPMTPLYAVYPGAPAVAPADDERIGASPMTRANTRLPGGPTAAAGGGGGESASEMVDIRARTEKLTMQRLETTNSFAAATLERQNMEIKLSQMRALLDTEVNLLASVRAAQEAEAAALERLRGELASVERAHRDATAERGRLQAAESEHKDEIERLRGRLQQATREADAIRAGLPQLRGAEGALRAERDMLSSAVTHVEYAASAMRASVGQARGLTLAPYGSGSAVSPRQQPSTLATVGYGSPSGTSGGNASPLLAGVESQSAGAVDVAQGKAMQRPQAEADGMSWDFPMATKMKAEAGAEAGADAEAEAGAQAVAEAAEGAAGATSPDSKTVAAAAAAWQNEWAAGIGEAK